MLKQSAVKFLYAAVASFFICCSAALPDQGHAATGLIEIALPRIIRAAKRADFLARLNLTTPLIFKVYPLSYPLDMGIFSSSKQYSPDALLSSTFVTFGQSIKVQSDTGSMTVSETFKYWDLFTWNLDTLVHNKDLSTQQANFILEATGHPTREKFELTFKPMSSPESFLKKQLICKSFFDYYLDSSGNSNNSGAGYELLDIPAFLRHVDSSWDKDPIYKGFIKILSVYLATVLRDTDRLAKNERKQLRESAFFWGALFITQWTERQPNI
jgi:hypothetical protein